MHQNSIMHVEAFFDEGTSTVSYIVLDKLTMACAIIDSVLDYDPRSGRIERQSADRLIDRVNELGASVAWILETHVHADHLSAAPYLREKLGGKLGIGQQITAVQETFGELFNAGSEFQRDGSQFDHLFADDEKFNIGRLQCRVMHTPGHTPACVTYVFSDGVEFHAFVGDTLFMPDYGTARCDFPGGDARALYRSANKILSLPDTTRLYMCHDYQPGGREVRYVSTVAQERSANIHIRPDIREDDFVAMRNQRDATLAMPMLMFPSVQVNMRGGNLPDPEDNGIRYLKIPLSGL